MTGDTLLSLYRLHSNLRRIAGAFRAYPGLVDAPCEDTVTALCGLPIATVTRPEAIGICIAYQNRTGPSWVGPAFNDGPDTLMLLISLSRAAPTKSQRSEFQTETLPKCLMLTFFQKCSYLLKSSILVSLATGPGFGPGFPS